MGSFANSVFQTMLGWLQGLVGRIWNLSAPGQEGDSLLGWVGANWKWLTLALCLFGLVTDWIVYLFRWQPYRVWRRFFRHLFRRDREEEPAPEHGTAVPASRPAAALHRMTFSPGKKETVRQEPAPWSWDQESERDAANRIAPDRSFPARAGRLNPDGPDPHMGSRRRQTLRPEADAEQERKPEEPQLTEPDPEEFDRTRRFEQSIIPRRRRGRVRDFFSEEAKPAAYAPPQELIDRREAYYRPVYPSSWKGRTDSHEEDGGL